MIKLFFKLYTNKRKNRKMVFMKINYCETITETETVRSLNRYFKLVFKP